MSEKDEPKRQQQKKKHRFNKKQIIVLMVILGLAGYALVSGIYVQRSENLATQSTTHHSSSDDDDEDYDDSGDDDSDYDSDDDEDYDSSSTDDELDDDDTSPFEGSKSKDKIGEEIAETMQSNFDAGVVKYDKSQGTVIVIPTDPDFVMAAADIATGASDTGDWDEMTSNFDDLSETIYDKYHSHIPLAIVNPKNTDKVLYETIDGSTVYDFAHDGSD